MSEHRKPDSARSATEPGVTPLALDGAKRAASGLHAGALLAERYRIEHPLGSGGSGEVWRAHDLELDLRVALKVPYRYPTEKQHETFEALRREVRLARRVASSNVCRVFDFLHFEGVGVMSMEYVVGTTLRTVLERRSPLNLERAHNIARQLLSGLEAIHAVGLVHCDIKPENVMLTDSGRVVLMDFSIARARREAGARPASRGTPPYIAPEEVLGHPLDARTDIYSTGVVLAEMIEPRGVRSQRARQRVWHGVRRRPPRLAATAWRPVLERTLAVEPDHRPQSARELARALEQVRTSGHTTGKGPGAFGVFDAEAGNLGVAPSRKKPTRKPPPKSGEGCS